MGWMAEHGKKRSRPADLVPDTCTVISARMDYLPQGANPEAVLEQSEKAYISRYALGRDYHKLIRSRLAKLAKRIASELGGGHYRAFVDSAPVLERALAENAGLGWIGKNTMLLNDKAGSWFFLGEIYTDVPLPIDVPQETQHCGSCTACLEVCPTQAFVGPWVLDARKCISYLTIELKESIPEAFSGKMDNWMFGCDICQDVCPWNRFAKSHNESDFLPKPELMNKSKKEWEEITEEVFDQMFLGSAVKRTKYKGLKRNIQFLKHVQ